MAVIIQDVVYPVMIFYRTKKRMIIRFKKSTFHVSVPKRTSKTWVEKQVLMHGKTLLEKVKSVPQPFTNQGLYLYGQWHLYQDFPQILQTNQKEKLADFSPYQKLMKNQFRTDLEHRVEHWKQSLKITTPYRTRVRIMQTRLGSNSRKTKTLTFAMKLMHFDWKIIDAVIAHELIHDLHFDHSKKFYDALYHAYPTYQQEHAKILRGQYR